MNFWEYIKSEFKDDPFFFSIVFMMILITLAVVLKGVAGLIL